jgi:hypothetical protein
MEMSGQLHALATLPPGIQPPHTQWIGVLVGPQTGLDCMEKGQISCLYRESNPGRPARSLVVIPTELSRLHKTGTNME